MTDRVSPSAGRPRLQIALDVTSLPAALGPLQAAAAEIDIIEVGTVLCLSEGMHAVRAIRALFPDHPVLADVRIAEAGSILSRLAFEAGASWVSVVAGATMTTVQQVCRVAQEYNGEVQIELGESYSLETARAWFDAGARHVIVHRSRDAEAAGVLAWTDQDIRSIHELSELGFTVTATGGITPQGLESLAGAPLGIVIAGRAIVAAPDPAAAARELNDRIAALWP